MKKLRFLGIIFIVAAIASFIGCPMEGEDDGGVTFVPVIGITGVPKEGTIGKGTVGNPITGTVEPPNATNKNIVWKVNKDASTTTATVTGNTITATAPGTLKGTVTIENGTAQGKNYTQTFTIQFEAAFVPVTGINDVPEEGTVGTALTLGGIVAPDNATNTTIAWSVNSTGTTATVTMSGNTVTATAPGTLKVTATITNGLTETTPYTKDFVIDFNIEPVTNIDDVLLTGTVNTAFPLNGRVEPSTATYKDIIWSVKTPGAGITRIETDNMVTATAPGTLKVTATIINGKIENKSITDYTKDFDIVFSFEPVTGITGVPTTGTVGTELPLTGTVAPANASYKTISWTVTDAGTTGITTGPMSGNTVTATTPGTLKVTATITNGLTETTPYTEDFVIDFFFVQVSGIAVSPLAGTVGTPFTLKWTVVPSNATNQDIIWTISESGSTATGTVSGHTVDATTEGDLLVRATIVNGVAQGTNFTHEVTIHFSFAAVTSIIDVPTRGTVGTELTLAGTVKPDNASKKTIAWSVKDEGNTGITAITADNKVTATASGTLKVTATITNGKTQGTENYTQDFDIVFE